MGSPRHEQSASGAVALTYIGALRDRDPALEVDTLNVWDADLPEFGLEEMNAKYAGIYGIPLTDRQKTAWDTLAPLVERIVRADEIVLSVPMWNFGIPYKLKHLTIWCRRRTICSASPTPALPGWLMQRPCWSARAG